MNDKQPSKMIKGAPYTVTRFFEHVSIIDNRGYAVAEIQFGTGGMPTVEQALEYARAWIERLNQPIEDTPLGALTVESTRELLGAEPPIHVGERPFNPLHPITKPKTDDG